MMFRLPFILKIKPDELLYSYILRMAKANACSDLKAFVAFFIQSDWTSQNINRVVLSYDVAENLSTFVQSLGEEFDTDLTTFFLKTSIFPAVSPFSSKIISAHRIGAIYDAKKFRILDPSPNCMISNLYACPKCYYFRR